MTALRDTLVDFARPSGLQDDASAPFPARQRIADHVFAVLYTEHGARIHRFLRDLLGDAALAADATQETFVRAFRQEETFDASRAVAPWLFGIARNVSLEVRRARHRARRVVIDDGSEAPEPRTPSCPERELLGREALHVVAAAVERLSDDRRAMLLLRLDHHLAYEEIAELMGFSVAKVKVEIFRAREVLREVMNDYENGGAR